MDLAVLSLVTLALEKVVDRWSELGVYLQALLEGDDALLDPTQHDNLLFDSEDFSKSREYFWAINCLTEFEASISANIEHWESFRKYLIPTEESERQKANSSQAPEESLFLELIKRSDEHCDRLQRYQRFFQEKRTATIALRDGVGKISSNESITS